MTISPRFAPFVFVCLAILGICSNAMGQVSAWGDSANGQNVVPSGLSGVAQVACGFHLDAVLLSNGTVKAWGSSQSGDLNTGQLSGVTSISVSGNSAGFGLALLNNGTVA